MEGQFGDREAASQGPLLSLKREIMTNAHFSLGAEGGRHQLFWRVAKIAL